MPPAEAIREAAEVVEVLHQLAGRWVWIDDLLDAVPGVELELGHIGDDLVALDRDRPGLLGNLAERAVEPVLGAGAVGDAGDAADEVAALPARRRRAIGVGDVVGRERPRCRPGWDCAARQRRRCR